MGPDDLREVPTEVLRAELARRTRRGAPRRPIPHGTPAGYRAHRRRREDACDECKEAWRTKG